MIIMPSYYDEETKNWYCKFYYINWQGQKKQKKKRGFPRKKDSQEWERKFLEQFAKNPDISFETLYLKYKEYITPRIRESTAQSRFAMIDKHILPYFKDLVVSDISPADIVNWQNEMLKKNLSETYLNQTNTYLRVIFNYAVDYVGLSKSPCLKTIGSKKTRKLNFWTPEEYSLFIQQFTTNIDQDDNLVYFTLFEVLYYTGMRKGELQALQLSDIDFSKNQIHITKTYYRIPGKDLINPPKTPSSERVIDIPTFLSDELKQYISHLYKPAADTRLFEIKSAQIRTALDQAAKAAGVKRIRVHDIRHSHASTLINLGANPVLVAERLGHESPNITLKIYAHLFPHQQVDIVNKIKKV